jgi:hypothetical protein
MDASISNRQKFYCDWIGNSLRMVDRNFLPRKGDLKMKSCEKCKFRARYDKNPQSLFNSLLVEWLIR